MYMVYAQYKKLSKICKKLRNIKRRIRFPSPLAIIRRPPQCYIILLLGFDYLQPKIFIIKKPAFGGLLNEISVELQGILSRANPCSARS
jgi:hypothetical protein